MSFDQSLVDFHDQIVTAGQRKDGSPIPLNASMDDSNHRNFEYSTLTMNGGFINVDEQTGRRLSSGKINIVPSETSYAVQHRVASDGLISFDQHRFLQQAFPSYQQSATNFPQAPALFTQAAARVSQPAVNVGADAVVPSIKTDDVITIDDVVDIKKIKGRAAVQKSRAKSKRQIEEDRDLLKRTENENKNLKLENANLRKKSKQDDREKEILRGSLSLAGDQSKKDANETLILEGCLFVAAELNDDLQRQNDDLQRKNDDLQRQNDDLQRKNDDLQRKNDDLQRKNEELERVIDERDRTEIMLRDYQKAPYDNH